MIKLLYVWILIGIPLEEKKNIEFCVGCELVMGTKNDKINVCLWQKNVG